MEYLWASVVLGNSKSVNITHRSSPSLEEILQVRISSQRSTLPIC